MSRDTSRYNSSQKPPAVSVIIPTYNRWPMVADAIESVLAQSYSSFEVIVVDDGSTDGTRDQLSKFGSKIRLIAQQRRGVAAARNLGVGVAKAGYIAFLDSDDLWLPKKLEIQAAFMNAKGVEICQTEEIWIRNGVRVNPKAKHQKPSGDIFRRSLELCLVSPSAVMMTKALFEETGGFDESFPVCEDYDLWLRVSVASPVSLIPAPLVVKCGGHADQLSRSTWGMDRYRIAALEKLLQSGLSGEKHAWVMDALRRKVAILSRGARRRGKEGEADAYEAVLPRLPGENRDVGRADSGVCKRQRISSADAATVVRLAGAG